MAHDARRTIDQEIRRWLEAHGGKPAHVERNMPGDGPRRTSRVGLILANSI